MAIFTELWSIFCGTPNSLAPAQRCEGNCGLPLSLNSELLHTFRLSSCSRHALIASIHLVFLRTFCSIVLIKWVRRTSILRNVKPRKPFRTCVAVINIILGAIYLGLGIWFLQEKLGNGFHLTPLHQWLVLLVQGLAWFTLGLTVTSGLTRPVATFVLVWWIVSFLLGTVDCVSAGLNFINDRELPYGTILSLVSWPACCLMLICAAKNDLKGSEDDLLSEPLLNSRQRFSEEDQMLLKLNSNVTPFAKAGFFNRMTFWWLNSLLSKGMKRPLEEVDLPCVCGDDQATNCYTTFTEELLRQKQKNPSAAPSVFWALVSCHWKNLARTGFYAFLKILTLSSGPLLLNAFIGFSEGKQSFKYEGFILVGTLFIAKAIESLSQRQWYFGTRRIGLQMRSSLIAAIYQKQLKLSSEAKQVHTAGGIMNYMAVDAYRIGEFLFSFHQTWTTVLQLIFALSILVHAIGWATLSALAVIIITMLCNSPLAKLQQKFQTELMSAQDQRLRATTEALVHMKVLKLHAWDERFKKSIEKLRMVEFKWLSAVQFRRAYGSFLSWSTPVLVSTSTFLTCYFLNIPLTPSNVFTFIATLCPVQEPIRIIPDAIAVIIQAKVSLSRIINFLEATELQDRVVEGVFLQNSDNSLLINSATFSWVGIPVHQSPH